MYFVQLLYTIEDLNILFLFDLPSYFSMIFINSCGFFIDLYWIYLGLYEKIIIFIIRFLKNGILNFQQCNL